MSKANSIIDPRWPLAIAAGAVLALFAAYPQLRLWYHQGSAWNGHYAYNDIDEVAYAAYLKALMDGRPRKNDPYSGRDESAASPQPESLFSIQFAAPYTVAGGALLLGIDAPTAMTLTGLISGFLTAFLCFLFFGYVCGADPPTAFAGALAVLCGGALAAGEGAIGELLGTGFPYPYFPFLRRYVPAAAFPAFFSLLIAIWMLCGSGNGRRRVALMTVAVVSFGYLVFSYFYIWTAAAAWLFAFTALVLIARPEGWRRISASLAYVAAGCLIPLLFFLWLLADRAPSIDTVQLLVYTHDPDLWRFPEYVSVAAAAVILSGFALKRIRPGSLSTVFISSLVVVPFLLFNQQVVTGRSLQPIHYQVFIGNYISALAIVAAVALFFRRELKKGALYTRVTVYALASAATIWGLVECHYTARVLDEANVARDRAVPVADCLRVLSADSADPHWETVFSLTNIQADDSPVLFPGPVLWSRHQHVFAGLSVRENRERYYRFLYYQSLEEEWLRERLRGGDFVSSIALFGWGRHSNRLSVKAAPLSYAEIDKEAKRFGSFVERFGPKEAADPALSYAVVPVGWTPDLSNLRKWYRMSSAKRCGDYIVYRLALRYAAEMKKAAPKEAARK